MIIMMSKRNILIPKPNSNFISVQCTECGEKRIIFTHTTTDINCKSCGQPLAKKAGAKANILGKVLNILD
jgi:small subunit ribosomal protein S27e